jgi:hypothetical protein
MMNNLTQGEIAFKINWPVKTMLQRVIFSYSGSESESLTLGKKGCIGLALATDGEGVNGNYDRVHAFHSDGAHFIFMAHNLEGFKLLEDQS